MRRAVRAVVVASSFVVLVGVSQASAAQLALTGAQRPHSSSYQRCDDGVGVTTPSTSGASTSVQVSGIAAACAGATLSATVYDPSTGASSTGSATVPAGGGAVTLDPVLAYTPGVATRALVTLATWPVLATWIYTPVTTYPTCAVYRIVDRVDTLQPGKSCTASVAVRDYWGTVGSRSANVDVAFTYTGASYPDYFRFTVDLRTAGLPAAWSWTTAGTSGGNLILAPSYRCSSLPILTGSSDPSWGPTGSLQFQLAEARGAGATCAP